MKVVLIDDEMEARLNLTNLLNEYCEEVKIIGEAESVKSGFRLLKDVSPDLVFLDVQMGDGTGFELLDFFPTKNFHIVFVTAFDNFAIRAFKYNAIDYLLKPIDPRELVIAVEKIVKTKNDTHTQRQFDNLSNTVKTNSFQTLTVSTQEGLYYLNVNEIIRIEASKNYSTFFLENGKKIMVSKSIGEFEKLLSDELFFRSHQSHIIQLTYVHQLSREDGGQLVMNDGQIVPISRRKKEEFQKIMASM